MSRAQKVAFVCVVSIGAVLAIAQFVLIGLNWSSAEAEAYYWRPAALAQGVIAVVYIAVGSFVAWRRPDNIVGWLVALIGVGGAGYQAVTEYAVHTLLVEPGTWPWGPEAGVLTQITWVLPFAAIPVLLLVYPTGRLLSRWWGAAAVLGGLGAGTILAAGVPLWQLRYLGSRLLFIDEEVVDPTGETWVGLGLVLFAVSLVTGMASAVRRWRGAETIERLQMQWLLVAGIIFCIQSMIVLTPLDDLPAVNVAGEILLLLGLLTMPFAIAVAVLRYRLYEIERILSRTVTYGVVTALVVLVYTGSVFLLRLMVPAEGQLAVAGSTLAAAAVFNPVRRRVQSLVDRRFNRDRYDAERILATFTGRLRNRSDLSALSRDLAEVAQETVQPMSISIWLRTGSPGDLLGRSD